MMAVFCEVFNHLLGNFTVCIANFLLLYILTVCMVKICYMFSNYCKIPPTNSVKISLLYIEILTSLQKEFAFSYLGLTDPKYF